MNDAVYTEMVHETRLYPGAGNGTDEQINYCILGLVGEAGEVANQWKKVYRDDGGVITEDRHDKLKDELGDVLWYVAALADELGLSLSEIKTHNTDKLLGRKANDTIHGDRRESDNEWYLG